MPVDGLGLEVVAERPVAKHLEHSMVVSVVPYLFEIVVLAADAQALLAVGHARAGDGAVAQYHVLELVHARVGEHQRGVVFNHHRGRRHYLVALGAEKLLEGLSGLGRSQH